VTNGVPVGRGLNEDMKSHSSFCHAGRVSAEALGVPRKAWIETSPAVTRVTTGGAGRSLASVDGTGGDFGRGAIGVKVAVGISRLGNSG